MKFMEKASIKKVFWQDVREKVSQVNKPLADVIDEICPDNSFPLYLAKYPYGSTIVSEGTFYLPTDESKVIAIDNKIVDSQIKDDLTFIGPGIPAGVVLKNTIHEAVTTSHQILPLGVVSPGSIFALWKKLDADLSYHPINMFTLTAGARFIFMVPNISNLSLHKNLRRDFNINIAPPKNLLDQWEIFKAIVDCPNLKCDWETEVLFFSKKWFQKMEQDKAWQSFHLLLLETAWKRSAYERNVMFYDLAFSRVQEIRNLKPNPYIADTAKHLFMVAAGVVIAFAPAINDMSGPIALLQKVYLESYGVEYNPTIFVPAHFSLSKEGSPVYYSMPLPTTLEFAPKSRKVSSTMNDLSELMHVVKVFFDEIKNNRLKVKDTILGEIVEHVELEFFHNKPDRHNEIKLTTQMAVEDPNLLYCAIKTDKKFADSGTPVRGCVRIANKN